MTQYWTAADAFTPQAQAAALYQLIDEEFSWRLGEFPELGERLHFGDHPALAFDRISDSDQQRRRSHWVDVQRRLSEIGTDELARADFIAHLNYSHWLGQQIDQIDSQIWRLPFDPFTHFINRILIYLPRTVRQDPADLERYLHLLGELPGYLRDCIELLRVGAQLGFVPSRSIVEAAIAPAGREAGRGRGHDVFSSPLLSPYRPWLVASDAGTSDARYRWARAAYELITGEIADAFADVAQFLSADFLPLAPHHRGAFAFPEGERLYAAAIRQHTGAATDPQVIHERGRSEVTRILQEQRELLARWRPNQESAHPREVNAQLRADPANHPADREELLERSRRIARASHEWSAQVIGTPPRTDWHLELVPSEFEQGFVGARYIPASHPGAPGTIWINGHDLSSRPWYSLESLIVHEGSPGHHIQLALAQEADSHPATRAASTGWIEGWALYAETLAAEQGFYTDELSLYGKLSNEAWRAARLVVDTGLHALGWSIQEAEEYLEANTALGHSEISGEVQRYLSWPGQALAYKLGELTIADLRERYRQHTGAGFDLVEFHDRMLAGGFSTWAALEYGLHHPPVKGNEA